MRRVIFFVFILFIISLSAAQPFGFRQGMTFDELKEIDPDISLLSDDIYVVNAPKPSPLFDFYAVCIHKIEGLYSVTAFKSVETNVFGTTLKSNYEDIVDGISGIYGEPTSNRDYLFPGSIWDEPEDYMMSLAKEERTLFSLWDLGAVDNGGLEEIILNVTADSINDGNITLGYKFKNFDKLNKDGKEKTQW
jgi:hypothetical protein